MNTLRNIVRRFHRERSGASAVEFALIIPIFLSLLFGIVMYGAYLAVVNDVQQLAAEAARSSVAGLSESERNSLAVRYVTTNASGYPLIEPQRITVQAATSSADSNAFVVTVNYDASDMFIYSLPAFVPAPPPTIVRSAVIPHGGY